MSSLHSSSSNSGSDPFKSPHDEITEISSSNAQDSQPIASTSSGRVAPPARPPRPTRSASRATSFVRKSSSFVGREAELQTLLGFFEVPYDGQSILVLSGPEGIGKTRLVLKFAEVVSESRKSTPIFHIDATSSVALDRSLASIAQSKGVGDTTDAALAWLASLQEDFFLCIDSADTLGFDLSPYLPLKAKSKHARILLSTRSEANQAMKNFAAVSGYGGTGLQSFLTLGPLSEQDGKELLVREAKLEENPKQADFALALAKELEFHPIAIIQASAVIRDQRWTAKDYLAEFTKLKTQLSIDSGLLIPDNEGFSAQVAWRVSYDRISPTASHLLRLFSQLHHLGFTERLLMDSFHSFSHFVNPDVPYSEEDLEARANVQRFFDAFASDGITWNSEVFDTCMRELHYFSLIRRRKAGAQYPGLTFYSIRSIIHNGLRELSTFLTTTEASFLLSSALVPHCHARATPGIQAEFQLHLLVPHVQRLLETPRGSDYTTIHPLILSLLATCIHRGTHRYADAEPLYRTAIRVYKDELGLGHPTTIGAIARYVDTPGADTLVNDSQSRRAEEMQLQVVEVQQAERGEEDIETLLARSNLARALKRRGRFQRAVKMQRDAVVQLARVVEFNDPRYLGALVALGDVFHAVGAFVEERKLRVQVVDGRRETLGEDHEDTVQALADLAQSHAALGEYDSAESLQRRVIQHRRTLVGADNLDAVWAMVPLVVMLLEQGDSKEKVGEQMARDIYHRTRAVFGPDHPTTLRALALVALALNRQGWFAQAERLDREVLAKRRATLGSNHFDTILAQQALAATFTDLDRLDDTVALRLSIVEKSQKKLGPTHLETLRAQVKLATTFLQKGMKEEAATLDASVLVKRIQALGLNHIDTVQSLTSAAAIMYDAGYKPAAAKLSSRAVKIATQMMGPRHSATVEAEKMANLVSQPRPKGARKHSNAAEIAELYSTVWAMLTELDRSEGSAAKVEGSAGKEGNTSTVSRRLSKMAAPLTRMMSGGKSR